MRLTPTCLLASMLLFSGLTPAGLVGEPSSSEATPIGRWKTVDDATGKVKSLVVIWAEHDRVYGMIERILDRATPTPDAAVVRENSRTCP